MNIFKKLYKKENPALVLIISFGILTFLISTFEITIYSEFYYYSWLLSKGELIYRDFFINHGFLIYYLLIPFSFDKTLILLKLLFVALKLLNLGLLYIALRRVGSSYMSLTVGILLYVFSSFYYGENTLWDELFLESIFLAVFLVLRTQASYVRTLMLGLMVAFASFIKPSASLVLLPVFFVTKSKLVVFSFLFWWIVSFFVFYLAGSHYQYFDNVFLYNKYYSSYFSENGFLKSLVQPSTIYIFMLLFFNIYMIVLLRLYRKYTSILMFLFASLIFVFPIMGSLHYPPLVAFLSLSTAIIFNNVKKESISRKIIIFFIVLFGILSINSILERQDYTSYYNNNFNEQVEDFLRLHGNPSFYVNGVNVASYYKFDKPVITYVPIVFTWVSNYYKDTEKDILNTIKKEKIQVVIRQRTLDEPFQSFFNLNTYIHTHYFPAYCSNEFNAFFRVKEN